MRKIYSLILTLVFLLAMQVVFVSAVSASSNVPVAYSFSSAYLSQTVTYSSFELQVTNTNPGDLGCRYSTSPTSFANMSNLSYQGPGVYFVDFINLNDGDVWNYYIKCNSTLGAGGEPPQLQVQVNVDLPVKVIGVDIPNANDLTNPPTLSSGRYELTLHTSKPVRDIPTLTYSFDGGVTSSPIPLFGAGNIWNGYLIIPGSVGQGAVSLCFNAFDLGGIQANLNTGPGTCGQIISGSVFPVDTQKPPMLADINAVGNIGNIVLNWYPNSPGLYQYNIYRSNSPGVDFTDYYSQYNSFLNSNRLVSYTDSGVQKGQTYYYRIAAVDDAGNVGDMSQEISATVLTSNAPINSPTGLSPQLLGYVQNFLTSADSVISNINSIKSSISLKNQDEQQLFSAMGFSDQLDQAITQIQSMERSAQALELQDLTEQQISTQISSLNVKLGIAQTKIPTDLTILDSASDSYAPGDNEITSAMMLYNSSLSQSEVSRGLKNALDYIKSSGMQIVNSYYVVKVTYLDGTINTLSVVSRQMKGQIEGRDNTYFIENIPKDVASSASDVNVVTGSNNVIQKDPVLSFGTGNKVILYYMNGNKSISALKETNLAFIMPGENTAPASITGNFLVNISDISSYGGIAIGVILVIALLIYFIFLKKKKLSDSGMEVLEILERIDKNVKDKIYDESVKLYSEIKEKYKNLSAEEKKIFYKKIKNIHDRISKYKKEEKDVSIPE